MYYLIFWFTERDIAAGFSERFQQLNSDFLAL